MVDIVERLRLNGTDWVFGDTAIVALKEINKLRSTVSEQAERIKQLEFDNAELTKALRVGNIKELQAEGKHPAPCAKFCEATAFRIDERRLNRQITEARDRIVQLEAALQELLRVAPSEITCDNLHHRKKDQHACNEPCPIEIRYSETIENANKVLQGE